MKIRVEEYIRDDDSNPYRTWFDHLDVYAATKVATARFTGPGAAATIDFEELFSRGARPARVPNKAGMNNFNWNMRYPDAARFDGLIMWAGTVTGPMAPPGAYSVRMTAGTVTQTYPFRIKKDPRSDATDADLQAQFKMLLAIRDRTTDANMSVRASTCASTDSGTWTAIWSPSKSALKAAHTSGCS